QAHYPCAAGRVTNPQGDNPPSIIPPLPAPCHSLRAPGSLRSTTPPAAIRWRGGFRPPLACGKFVEISERSCPPCGTMVTDTAPARREDLSWPVPPATT